MLADSSRVNCQTSTYVLCLFSLKGKFRHLPGIEFLKRLKDNSDTFEQFSLITNVSAFQFKYLVMSASTNATFGSCIRGFHAYKDIWDASIGEVLECEVKSQILSTKYSLQRGKLCIRTVKIYSLQRGFRYSRVRYSGVRFHIFYCNSAGLSNVVRYNGVFVIAEFVIAGCHCMPQLD